MASLSAASLEVVRSADIAQTRAILQVRPELVNREAPSSGGHMALHYAVMDQHPEMVRLLMQFGANPYTTTAGIYALRDATTPLAIAVERGHHEIAAIIREEEKKREAGRPIADESPVALRRALQNRDEDAAIDLLEHHPELVELQMPGGRWTLLHMASALLLERVAIWLLQHGADANRHATDGSTPVDVAGLHCDPADREHGGVAMTRLLLNHGALLQGDYEFLRSNRRPNRIVWG